MLLKLQYAICLIVYWRSKPCFFPHPQKLQHNEELKYPDFDYRQDFVNLAFNKMEEQHNWLHAVLQTDKAHVIFSGAVNIHICRVYTTETPHGPTQIYTMRTTVTYNIHISDLS